VETRIALLRGINVGAATKVPMERLRAMCGALGWEDVRTYIASGNVLFRADGESQVLEGALEAALERTFGRAFPVLVRSGEEWREYASGSPFPDAEEREPNRLMIGLSKRSLAGDAVEKLREKAVAAERIVADRGALWIHFPDGAGTSKLSPSLLDRAAGSPLTMRNWGTVVKLGEMVGA
jgi:uncharacterized protein (DUF1697 family)